MSAVPDVRLIKITTQVSHMSTKELTIEVDLAESRCYSRRKTWSTKYLLTVPNIARNAVKS